MSKQKLLQVEVLQEKYEIPYSNSGFDAELSKTAQFMLPAIGLDVTAPIVFKYFTNAFLGDRTHEHNYERPIFTLFEVKDYKDYDWNRVYNAMIKSVNYITEYDVGIQDGKYLIMLVFTVPEKYAEDYMHFRNGRYSLFSKDYKLKFPQYLDNNKKTINTHWQIIHKDKALKEQIEGILRLKEGELDNAQEIWDIPRHTKEYYRFKK